MKGKESIKVAPLLTKKSEGMIRRERRIGDPGSIGEIISRVSSHPGITTSFNVVGESCKEIRLSGAKSPLNAVGTPSGFKPLAV